MQPGLRCTPGGGSLPAALLQQDGVGDADEAVRLSMPTVKSSSELCAGAAWCTPAQRFALPTPYATMCLTCACVAGSQEDVYGYDHSAGERHSRQHACEQTRSHVPSRS